MIYKLKNLLQLTVVWMITLFTLSLSYPENRSIPPIIREYEIVKSKDINDYIEDMAKLESGQRLSAVNQIGMLGLYQFSPTTLKRYGINTDADRRRFLASKKLQDSIMIEHITDLRNELATEIRRFSGVRKNGVLITESGLLAGAHLVGVAGLKSWLYPNQFHFAYVDGNGVPASEYVRIMAGYRINLEEARYGD